MSYKNGNAEIDLQPDGTRIIKYDGKLRLDYPLNIDIRVSTKCAFGLNPTTGKAFCDFCHESAKTDGVECNYAELQKKLTGLPQGIELAIGSNNLTPDLISFLQWVKQQGYIANLTINQGHLKRDNDLLRGCVIDDLIKGLGISYRSKLPWDVPQWILDYPHTIFHVIAGIDTVQDVLALKDKGVKKVLVLGEKDFGFNVGNVNLETECHKHWYWYVTQLFAAFEVVSFDNLALQQLNIRRFFNKTSWETFNQGEHSIYINAVDEYFAASSRSNAIIPWGVHNVKSAFFFFKEVNNA